MTTAPHPPHPPSARRPPRMGSSDGFTDYTDLSLYLRDIGRYPLLTTAEELAAARLCRLGDPDARDLLIRSNLRLVIGIARSYAGRGMPMEDLVAEGTLGLIRAIEDFDPESGNRLSTYACWWIKQHVRRAIADRAAMVRVPSWLFDLMGRFRRAERVLARSSDHAPTFDEVADSMGVTATDRRSLALARRALRVRTGDGLAGNDSDDDQMGPIDRIPSRPDADGPDAGWAAVARSEDALMLGRLLGCLDDRERAVVAMRYGLGGAAPEYHRVVARRMGVSPELARQIWRRAAEKMRRVAEANGWAEFGEIVARPDDDRDAA